MAITMTPELLYQIVSSNPNLSGLVEKTLQVQQMSQGISQQLPTLQHMVQNPMQTAQSYVNWQQQQPQQQAAPAQQTPQQQQVAQSPQGGTQVDYMAQAKQVVDDVMASLNTINGNIKGLYDETEKLNKRLEETRSDIATKFEEMEKAWK